MSVLYAFNPTRQAYNEPTNAENMENLQHLQHDLMKLCLEEYP
jgi:hypothetical protein